MQFLNLSASLLLTLFFTPLLILSSKSFVMLWILLELNNMAFIYLFVLNNSLTSHMPMNFFLVQTISSLSIIIYIMMNHKSSQEPMLLTETSFILLMGLLMKMALPPFHMWMIKMSKIATWNMNIMFITWQKIVPIFIMMKLQNFLFTFISMFFLWVGTFLQFMFIKIKPLIISSSIVHMGWLIIPQSIYKVFPLLYLFMYTLIITPLILILKKTNKWKLMKTEQKNNFFLAFNIFNLGSIPPLTGFILKWMIFLLLIQQKMNMIYMLILFSIATISFYIYFQIMYNTLFKTYMQKKSKINSYFNFSGIFSFMAMILPIFMFL